MATNNKGININNIYNLINELKKEFTIIPEINSIEELEFLLYKEVTIIHNDCNHKEVMILLNWLNLKRNLKLQNDSNKYIHYCKKCFNEIKKADLQNYLDETYNKEFTIVGEYIDFNIPIGVKHNCCDEIFYKTPTRLRNSQLICKFCGKSDALHEDKKRLEKNKELKNKFEENNVTTYIPLEDSKGITKKIRFKHLTCGEEFIGSPYDIYNHYNKHDHCPNCFKKKVRENTSEEVIESKRINRIKNRYLRFKKFAEEFIFEPEINSFEDFERLVDTELTITHKSCGFSVKSTLDDWGKKRSASTIKLDSDEYLYLCPQCSEKVLREDFQNYLDENYNKEFVVTGKYTGSKKSIEITHILCGTSFEVSPSNAKQKTIICKGCNRSDSKRELEKIKIKNDELKEKLKENGLLDYIPLEDFVGYTKKMKFKHLRCGNIIEETPQSLLRPKIVNKHLCSQCPEVLLNNETDIKLRTSHAQDILNLLYDNNKFKIVGEYDDNDNSIRLKHEDCNKEFSTFKKSLFTKPVKCPHCETNNFKNNKFISLREKIELYENELDNQYKILKPFIEDEETVPFKHLECGHVFERTVASFLRAKGKIFCPKCREKAHLDSVVEKLKNKYDNEYLICDIKKYGNVRTPLDFKHTTCGHIFESNLEKMLNNKTIPCPKCNPNSKTIESFKSKMYEKCKGEYTLTGEFKGFSKKTTFRHKTCGRGFSKTPHNFLTSNIPCTHCSKEEPLMGIKEAQKRVNKTSNGLFKLNGIYRGILKDIPVTCTECGHVFESTPKKMFLRKKCPNCKASR